MLVTTIRGNRMWVRNFGGPHSYSVTVPVPDVAFCEVPQLAGRDELLAMFDPDPSWLGRLFFNLVYGGRTIRREPE